jgi:aerobic C4-dicarboxylate transport protein
MARVSAPASPSRQANAGALRFLGKMYVQVVIAVIAGAWLGYSDPALAIALKPLADAFIKAIRMIVAPIIFTTVVVGIARMEDLRRVASVGLKSLLYFEAASTLALLIGLAVGNLWPIGQGMNIDPATLDAHSVASYTAAAKSMTLVEFLLSIIPASFLEPFVKGDLLPVLFIAILFGLGLARMGEQRRQLVSIIDQIAHGLFAAVGMIMRFAPVGAFAAMAFTIGKFGLRSLLDLGQLVAGVYVVSILFVVLVLGLFLRLAGFRLWRVLDYFKDEILFVFAATSAETMLPRAMQKLERLGCRKEVVGLVMPSGFSLNMDGTAIYMTMAVLFVAHATNIHLSLEQQLMVLFIMLFTSKGAAGVTGGGFVALAATMPAIDVLPVGGLALLFAVDRFMAEIRAATNLTSNIIATLVVGRWAAAVDPKLAMAIMAGARETPDRSATEEQRPAAAG